MRFHVPDKLALTLCLLLTSLTAPPPFSLAVLVIVLFSREVVPDLKSLDKETARRFRRVIGVLLAGAVIMTILNGMLIPEGRIVYQWRWISLYEDGLAFGLRTGSRLLLMTTTLLVLFGSTPLSSITSFLRQAGVPHQVVTTIHLTVHFVAAMPSRIERIYAAQEARGAPVRARFLSRMLSLTTLFSPLVLSSIVESIERGKALELRGYNSSTDKGVSYASPDKRTVSFLTMLFLFLSIVALSLPWLLE